MIAYGGGGAWVCQAWLHLSVCVNLSSCEPVCALTCCASVHIQLPLCGGAGVLVCTPVVYLPVCFALVVLVGM